jgi:hypothetical protein
MTQAATSLFGSKPDSPIDLRARFGGHWKIGLDEAARGRWGDPWNYTVVCRHGHLYPVDSQHLGAATATSGATARRLRSISGVEVVADGDDGINAAFPLELIGAVEKIMRPCRVRRASARQLAALADGRRLQNPLVQNDFLGAGGVSASGSAPKPSGRSSPDRGRISLVSGEEAGHV